ncbi:hypothetical protein PF005_g15338 [Phytophthora fragariae]|uniref:Uncharacterized protein n=1 Tax=Phytophthora fragariae TaxID=53985 RepID=A0A6A3J2Q5_9STRA|nr:hypothetical protein PF011_g19267 [Phytophthora fragariae]KAE9099507.1 hypothetical protein PF007_g15855 [Phytophthora fragariae]KAE9200476.1 hypothetical protein PF005_g15338 [Phytophthora fragariae]
MLECYVELRSHARLVEAVENFVPSSSGHKKLVDVLRHLRKFDSVCKRLQCEATTLSEGGLVKLAYGGDLSATETAALKRQERPIAEERPQATGGKRKKRDENYAAQIIEQGGAKRRKTHQRCGTSPVYSSMILYFTRPGRGHPDLLRQQDGARSRCVP